MRMHVIVGRICDLMLMRMHVIVDRISDSGVNEDASCRNKLLHCRFSSYIIVQCIWDVPAASAF